MEDGTSYLGYMLELERVLQIRRNAAVGATLEGAAAYIL